LAAMLSTVRLFWMSIGSILREQKHGLNSTVQWHVWPPAYAKCITPVLPVTF